MIRKSFVMYVNPDAHAEYERRHDPIWEELAAVLRAHGVHNYSIHLDERTNTLFGYAEIEDEEGWESMAREPVCQRWWAAMSDIMPTHDDHRPITRELREVFHLP